MTTGLQRRPHAVMAALIPVLLTLAACSAAPAASVATPPPSASSRAPSAGTAVPTPLTSAAPANADPSGAWTLEGGTLDGTPLRSVAAHPFTLMIETTRIGGRACNEYGADAVIAGDGTFRVGDVIATRMACVEEGVTEAEATYLAALPRVVAFRLLDDRLELAGEGVRLAFVRAVAAPSAGSSVAPQPSSGETPGSATPDPAGEWELTNGTVDDFAIPLVADAPITLTVEATRVSGVSACNQYGGDAIIAGDGTFQVGGIVATEMACAEDVMASESAYQAALPRVVAFRLEGDTLELAGDGVRLMFQRVAPPAVADLVGTRWLLDTLIDGDTAQSAAHTAATLELRADGTLSGTTGCKAFEGSYTIEDDEIRTTGFGATATRCAQDLDRQDVLIREILGDRFRVEIDGQRLLVMSADRGLGYQATEAAP